MAHEHCYRIDYLLIGADKKFYVRASAMTNAEEWHWASIDAGVCTSRSTVQTQPQS